MDGRRKDCAIDFWLARRVREGLADENLDNDILRGLFRRVPTFDIVRVQDVGLAGADDSTVLDVSTMIPALRLQLERASDCAPIVLVPDSMPIGLVIDEVVLLDRYSIASDWSAAVLYLPLR